MSSNPTNRTTAIAGQIRAMLPASRRTLALVGVLVVALMLLLVRSWAGKPARAQAQSPGRPAAQPWPRVELKVPFTPDPQREQYLAQLDREITRDPFASDPSAFPRVEPQSQPAIANLAAQEAARRTAEAAAEAQRQARLQEVQARGAKLKLQSIMLGSRPTAAISGQMVHVGDQIDGFVVRQIDSSQCLLACEEIQVTLKLE
jgi:hypothetical protein